MAKRALVRHRMIEKTDVRVVIYCRISDDREGTRAGVERQEKLCRDLAKKRGWLVIAVFVDDDISASAATRKRRPEYQRLLATVRASQADMIVSYTLKRLTRRYREGADLIDLADQAGVGFSFVRAPEIDMNSAAGRKHFRGMVNDAISESEETGERVRDKFVEKATAGEYRGGPRPFGWAADGVTPVMAELDEITTGSDEVLAAGSLRSIAARWNDMGLRGTKGARWTTTTVRQVLTRWRNAGVIEVDSEVLEVNGEPVKAAWYHSRPVELETVRAVRAVLSDPNRRTAAGNAPRWLGSGLYLCWGCEHADMRVSGPAVKTRMYRCQNNHEVKPERHHVARQALALDEWVEDVLVARLSEKDGRRLLRRPKSGPDVAKLHAERGKVTALIAELDDDRDNERITRSRYLERNERLNARLEAVDEQLAASFQVDPLAGLVGVADVRAVWFGTKPDRSDGLSLERRRAVLDSMATVTILPAVSGRNEFDSDTVLIKPKR